MSIVILKKKRLNKGKLKAQTTSETYKRKLWQRNRTEKK